MNRIAPRMTHSSISEYLMAYRRQIVLLVTAENVYEIIVSEKQVIGRRLKFECIGGEIVSQGIRLHSLPTLALYRTPLVRPEVGHASIL